MVFRLRERGARLTAGLLGALILQLTAVTHLHVGHGVERGAALIAAGESAAISQTSHADDASPACPICLLRAQSHSFAATQFTTVRPIDGPQHQTTTAILAPTPNAGRSPAAPRGPPTSFA